MRREKARAAATGFGFLLVVGVVVLVVAYNVTAALAFWLEFVA